MTTTPALKDIEASQRATAKMLGVSEPTIARDLGKSRGETNVASAWFQDDVDPAKLAPCPPVIRVRARWSKRSEKIVNGWLREQAP